MFGVLVGCYCPLASSRTPLDRWWCRQYSVVLLCWGSSWAHRDSSSWSSLTSPSWMPCQGCRCLGSQEPFATRRALYFTTSHSSLRFSLNTHLSPMARCPGGSTGSCLLRRKSLVHPCWWYAVSSASSYSSSRATSPPSSRSSILQYLAARPSSWLASSVESTIRGVANSTGLGGVAWDVVSVGVGVVHWYHLNKQFFMRGNRRRKNSRRKLLEEKKKQKAQENNRSRKRTKDLRFFFVAEI